MNSMSTHRILIVEDERPLSRALQLKLLHEKVESDIVSNGKEGLDKLRKGSYSLVILDLMMPMMDGFTFLENMKKEKIKTPVIVTSNLSQENDTERVLALGAVDYFVKSNTPLTTIVDRVVGFINKKK